MKRLILVGGLWVFTLIALAQSVDIYRSLDPENPILFGGDHIIYQGKKITLGKNDFFLDGALSDAVAEKYPYVFNTIQDAAAALSDGSESQPMVLYIAPWVYWVDDPDDPAVRKPIGIGEESNRAHFYGFKDTSEFQRIVRSAPFGMVIGCEWLRFYGLTDNPENVVLASNRGQTHGSEGNFTMFNIIGDGLSAENLTFGNYCNIDLEFPLEPALNREKRAEAIVQAQLVFSNADRAWARNTRFVSRLNLCPFSGAKRLLFDNCYFECTDDALASTGVYLNCRFGFYSSKPFYTTSGTGAVFLNCDVEVRRQAGNQYFTKRHNPMTVVDTRFHCPTDSLQIKWSGAPRDGIHGYEYNVTLNGRPVSIDEDMPWLTADMTGKPILEAYRIEYNGEVVYNTYNLLRGDDDWDPMGVKDEIIAAGRIAGRDYTNIPTLLRVMPESIQIESGPTTTELTVEQLRWGSYPYDKDPVIWSVSDEEKDLVTLAPAADGKSNIVRGTNENDETKTLFITASTVSGLESSSVVTVVPTFVEPPAFTRDLEILKTKPDMLTVNYGLELGNRSDESLITWYRCTDTMGSNPLAVAVSRLNQPCYSYTLTPGDVGHYIMAEVEPKHLRSHAGPAQKTVTVSPISVNDITETNFSTDFKNFPSVYQPLIGPGIWTVDSYKPLDTDYYNWTVVDDRDSWYYGKSIDASRSMGMIQAVRGARMLYTPVEGRYGDMSVELNVDPFKTAGQGFGSATGQYMDVLIKYDTETLTGYGLRIVRTPKYGDAVDFILMKYENGVSEELTEPVSSEAFRTNCKIRVEMAGNLLSAHVETTAQSRPSRPGVTAVVDLETAVAPNPYGGTGVMATGSTGESAILFQQWDINWK